MDFKEKFVGIRQPLCHLGRYALGSSLVYIARCYVDTSGDVMGGGFVAGLGLGITVLPVFEKKVISSCLVSSYIGLCLYSYLRLGAYEMDPAILSMSMNLTHAIMRHPPKLRRMHSITIDPWQNPEELSIAD